jgi:hypothetical protein
MFYEQAWLDLHKRLIETLSETLKGIDNTDISRANENIRARQKAVGLTMAIDIMNQIGKDIEQHQEVDYHNMDVDMWLEKRNMVI